MKLNVKSIFWRKKIRCQLYIFYCCDLIYMAVSKLATIFIYIKKTKMNKALPKIFNFNSHTFYIQSEGIGTK